MKRAVALDPYEFGESSDNIQDIIPRKPSPIQR